MSLEQQLREQVAIRLAAVLDDTQDRFASVSPLVPAFLAPARTLAAGGKRMRAILMMTGYRAAQPIGGTLPAPVIQAGVALELFQAAALVHDDIIDASDTRRGKPATHAQFATDAPADSLENPRVFGTNAAILLGDLLLVLADQAARSAIDRAGSEAANSARAIWEEMTSEVAIGQYLDVVNSTLPLHSLAPSDALAAALRVVRHKSARYSVEHPLALGAALAGGCPSLIAALRKVGAPLGEAFQLRDDVLGVYGDPERTGKPSGDDLREGKRTALIALARKSADSDARSLLERHVGDREMSTETVAVLQKIITESGAYDAHEALIQARLDRALDALEGASLPEDAARALRAHARSLAHRSA
ncbi:MAG: polyprenyl synthetase family protein [Bowdeniella nasicola]|nr:polyprenyl synthetase family protein [Bowdeniella nasicola]